MPAPRVNNPFTNRSMTMNDVSVLARLLGMSESAVLSALIGSADQLIGR